MPVNNCCRKPYNILVATGLMPSGGTSCCMPPIEFPNRIYADVIQTFSDTLVLNNTCEIVLSITPTSTTSYVPATVVHVQFGATYMELAMDNATNIIVQPGSNIAFDVLNADSVDVCIAINIYNVTCDVEYGNVIESMCVTYP